MVPSNLCSICQKQKAKRACPGTGGSICPQCCGTEREVSIRCPSECSYLRDSRRYEREKPTRLDKLPFEDVAVPDSFLYEHERFVGQIGFVILKHAVENPEVTDPAIIDALDKLVRTYQTEASGIYYESMPEEHIAIGVFRVVKNFLDELQKKAQEGGGITPMKNDDIIRSIVFLLRLAMVNSNQRPLGRYFIDFLQQMFPEAVKPSEKSSGVIIPGR